MAPGDCALSPRPQPQKNSFAALFERRVRLEENSAYVARRPARGEKVNTVICHGE